jgi:voltage-gated sodium channel
MAIDVDVNGSRKFIDKHWIYQVAEWTFLLYFLVEISVRFLAFERKCDAFANGWFFFDFSMVVLMSLDLVVPLILDSFQETSFSVLRIVRLVRIVRMARLAKILNFFPEFIVLIKGLAVAGRCVGFTLMLTVVVIYGFAVTFRYLTMDDEELAANYFRNVPNGMKTLMHVILPDSKQLTDDMLEQSYMCGALVVFYTVIASLTLLNMLIGVLCEVIATVSAVEKEAVKVTFVRDKLIEALCHTGREATAEMVMSRDEFNAMLLHPEALRVLQESGVDPVGLVDFTDYIFSGQFNDVGKEGLTFEKLVDLILRLGGDNVATVKDVVDARKIILSKLEAITVMLLRQIQRSPSAGLMSASANVGLQANS